MVADLIDRAARVLVTYASRMGSTAGIGEAIAERLRAAGLDVTVVPVSHAPDPEGFDAVVCGSAIYATVGSGPHTITSASIAKPCRSGPDAVAS